MARNLTLAGLALGAAAVLATSLVMADATVLVISNNRKLGAPIVNTGGVPSAEERDQLLAGDIAAIRFTSTMALFTEACTNAEKCGKFADTVCGALQSEAVRLSRDDPRHCVAYCSDRSFEVRVRCN